MWIILLLAGIWAGTQNALAGGGSFVTLPTLILSGLDPRAANITSTIALFPAQVTTGLAGRKLVSGAERLSFRALFIISLIGGVLGALLLLATPPSFFAKLVPWLVLFATAVFAWGSFFRKTPKKRRGPWPIAGRSDADADRHLRRLFRRRHRLSDAGGPHHRRTAGTDGGGHQETCWPG